MQNHTRMGKLVGWRSGDSQNACVQTVGRKSEGGDLSAYGQGSPVPKIKLRVPFESSDRTCCLKGFTAGS